MTELIFGYDIRVTHKNGRRVRVTTYDNTTSEKVAVAAYHRAKEANPGWRFILVVRMTDGSERVMQVTR